MDARTLTEELRGRWSGSYGSAPCPAHDDRTPSLSIKDGDEGRILVKCFSGCEGREVIDALKRMNLWPGGGDAVRAARNEPTFRERRAKREAKRRADEERRRVYAKRIWDESKPAPGTIVERYLRGRGLRETPLSIRYHPGLKHAATGLTLPAMVGAVCAWPSRSISGVHRTFLTLDGTNKAPVSGNKMMLGCCCGGAVRLAPSAEEMAVAEGIETALSVQQESGLPTWAGLNTSGIKGMRLPDLPLASVVTIAADHDCIDPKTGKRPGAAAAEKAAERWHAEGRKVRIALPDGEGRDFNDILQETLSEGTAA